MPRIKTDKIVRKVSDVFKRYLTDDAKTALKKVKEETTESYKKFKDVGLGAEQHQKLLHEIREPVSVAEFVKKGKHLEKYIAGADIEKRVDPLNRRVYDKIAPYMNAVEQAKANGSKEKSEILRRAKAWGIDDAEKLTSKELTEQVKSKAGKKVYAEINEQWEVQVGNLIGADEVLKKKHNFFRDVPEDSLDALKKYNKELYGDLVAAKSIAFSKIEQRSSKGWALSKIATIDDEAGWLYELAAKNNTPNFKESLKDFSVYKHIAESADIKLNNLNKRVTDSWRKLDDEAANGVRVYIESLPHRASPEMFRPIKQKLGKQDVFETTVMFNDDAMQMVRQQIGRDLTPNEIRFANRAVNIKRKQLETLGKISRREYSTISIADDIDRVTDDQIVLMNDLSNDFIKDYGIGYHPARATDEFKEILRKSGDDEVHKLVSFLDPIEQRASFQKARKLNSKLNKPENRLKPYEENDLYGREMSTFLLRKQGNMRLTNMGNQLSELDVIGNHALDSAGKKLTSNKALNDMRAMLKNMSDHWNIALDAGTQPRNIVMKAVANVTDLNTTFALSSPRLVFSNHLQPIHNSAQFHGVIETLKAYVSTSKLLPYLWSGKNVKHAMERVSTNTFSDLEKGVMNHYFMNEKPNLLMDDMFVQTGIMRKIQNIIALPFQTSDVHARTVTLVAATRQCEKSYMKYADDLAVRSTRTPKAMDKLIQELHLDEFNGLEVTKLLDAVGNKERFIREYATLSVNKELFNYSKLNRPRFIDDAKKNPLAARAMRFLTWNMYYKNVVAGTFRAWENGDKTPAKKMAAISLTWMATMASLDGFDIPFVSDFASYGLGRATLISPVAGMYDTATNRNVSGVVAPSLSMLAYLPTAVMAKGLELMGSEDNMFSWMEEGQYNSIKRSPIFNYPTIKNIMKESGLFDD